MTQRIPRELLQPQVRVDVASASNINLNSLAASTDSIQITGTTAITGFTVEAGRLFFVRFAGALTLTNNASIVTQTGANILTQAGDTCILRATAANTVEVLCYTQSVPQSLGDGQTWQNVTGSRVFGTTYTNTTGRPILVQVTASNINTTTWSLSVGGNQVATANGSGNNNNAAKTLTAVVPPGQTYSATVSAGSSAISNWMELR